MCRHQKRAQQLIAAYQDALVDTPWKRAEALAAIWALRTAFEVDSLSTAPASPDGPSCALSGPGEHGCFT